MALAASDLPESFLAEYVDAMREPGRLTGALDWYRALPFDVRLGGRVGNIAVDRPRLSICSSTTSPADGKTTLRSGG